MDNSILKTLADNPLLVETVKGVLINEFEGMAVDDKLSDELLGQQTRARLVGIKKIMEAFKKIESYRTVAVQGGDKLNQARWCIIR